MASYPFEIPADRMNIVNRYNDRGRLIIRIEKTHETVDFFGIIRERDLIAVTAKYEKSKHRETIVTMQCTIDGYDTASAAAYSRAMTEGANFRIIDRVQGRVDKDD